MLRSIYNAMPKTLRDSAYNINSKYRWWERGLKNKLQYGTTDMLTDLNIEINTSCNRRCGYCPNSVFERGLLANEKLMPERLYKKIIGDLAEIEFSGRISPHFYGEPLLDTRLLELLSYTRERLPKSKLVLVTNGDLLTVELYKNLVQSGVNSFCVTQHGAGMSKNMGAVFEFIKQNPKERVTIEYLKYDDTTPLFNRGGEIEPSVVNLNPRCRSANNPVVIDYAGNVVLCCNDYHSSIVFGNVNNSSLVEIWNSDRHRRLRNQFRKGIFSLDICKKCVGLK